MKAAAITTLILFMFALLGVGWIFLNANVSVESVSVQAIEASDQLDYFNHLKNCIDQNTVEGTLFRQVELSDANNYQFFTYSVRLKNSTFITADMIELQITPMDGDILQIGSFTPKALPRQSTGDIQSTILSDISMHSVRELSITYYIWGIPFITKTTSGR